MHPQELPAEAHVVIGWQSNGERQQFAAVILQKGHQPRMVAIVDDADSSLDGCYVQNYRQPMFEIEAQDRVIS